METHKTNFIYLPKLQTLIALYVQFINIKFLDANGKVSKNE